MHRTGRRTQMTITTLCLGACLSLGAPGLAQVGGGVTDRDITLAIETDLAVDDAIAAHRIDVETRGHVVKLSGSVDNLLARERATERAMATKGVRSVVNRIEVVAPARPDAELESDVRSALLADPATDSYEVDVSAAGGVITLEGTVDSWQEKQLSAMVAKGVRGVEGIENEIEVDYMTSRADYEITADIERRLGTSVWVDQRLLDVEVQDGRVMLSGTVGSEAERARAAALAWVVGVKSVSIDDVETDWWAGDRMRREERHPIPPDAEVADAIEAAMLYDPRVFSFSIDADVQGGIATLTGTVDNLKAKHAAGQNAKNTIGVWRVSNHLRVRPMAMPDDLEIATNVRESLMRDPYVERFDVEVDVVGGRVYLAGKVHTAFERQHAEDLAARSNGAIDVVNSIEYDREWERLSDREIEEDVAAQLFWSPFVDSRDIAVAVEDGVVTLTGIVEDWAEWRDAEANAFEGHAKDVRNELTVAGS